MSIVISRPLFCDRCSQWTDEGDPLMLAASMRRQALKAGWRRVGGEDLCPECVEEET